MTTALLHLRCKEIGLTFDEIKELRTGHILDLFAEKINDGADYDLIPTQEDFDNF